MNSLFAEALRLMRPFPFRTATVDLRGARGDERADDEPDERLFVLAVDRVRFDFEELLFGLDDERLEECETDDRE